MTNFSELRNHHLEFSGKQMITCERKKQSQDWMSSALLFTGRKCCPHRWNLTCMLSFPTLCLFDSPIRVYFLSKNTDNHRRPWTPPSSSPSVFFLCASLCSRRQPWCSLSPCRHFHFLNACQPSGKDLSVKCSMHTHQSFLQNLCFLQKSVQPIFNWS